MIEELTTLTFSSATASLASASVFSVIRSLQSTTNKGRVSNSTAALINVIAFIHYFRMRSIWDQNKTDIVPIRYSDWFLTCPLLLFEFFILMEWISVDDEKIKLSIAPELIGPVVVGLIATICMLGFGYLSEKTSSEQKKWIYYGIGFFFLLVLASSLKQAEEYKQRTDPEYNKISKFPWVFIAIWILYGLAYLMKSRDLWYNVLDIFAKAVFAVVIGFTVS